MPSFQEPVTQSELIVEGRVAAVLLDGLAYEIEVSEVFSGQVIGSHVRIGPLSDPGGGGCETTLRGDSHVVIAVADADEVLNALSTAGWRVGTDGFLSSTGGWWTMAANVADLRDMLRDAVPDTALSQPNAPPSSASAGCSSPPRSRRLAHRSDAIVVNDPSGSGEFEAAEERDRELPNTQRPVV
jgi:hypothetical protein